MRSRRTPFSSHAFRSHGSGGRPPPISLAPRRGEAGVAVLDPGWTVVDVGGTHVGVAGTKGFVGGFPDSAMSDFGEPSLRRVYRETTAEVEALERGLAAVADCALRIALLHYSPTQTT